MVVGTHRLLQREVAAHLARNRAVAAAAPLRIKRMPTSSTTRTIGSFQDVRSIS
jgi:hypothetical protein